MKLANALAEPIIIIDRLRQQESGAGLMQRLGIAAIRIAYRLLAPINHYGMSRVTAAVGKVSLAGGTAHYKLDGETVFAAPADDHYWSRLYSYDYRYEGEIEEALRALRNVDYALLDLGANYGYWTVLAASTPYGRKPVVAVEASGSSFGLLAANAAQHGSRVALERAAVWKEDGKLLGFSTGRHEARALVANNGAAEEVETTTIDSLVARHSALLGHGPLVMKLDVEGAEMAALEGAQQTLARTHVLIFEELNDESFGITFAAIKAIGRFNLFYFDPKTSRFHQTDSPTVLFDPAKAPRLRSKFGYNFFAVKPGSPAETALIDHIV